jgi:NADP-dependent 3-hydroxy acid dehydrogenase YdfG
MAYTYAREELAGKSVVITGGTTGIGRTTALRLAQDGANLLIFGRNEHPLNDALTDIRAAAKDGEVHGLIADSSKPEDIERVFDEADRTFGGVDILINNAAVSAQSVLDTDYSEWRSVIEINLLGYMACCRQAIDRMARRGDGHIVNVGSMSAKVHEVGSDVYVATKSAIEGFTDSFSKQANEKGIRITLIEPGLVGTDMTAPRTPPEQQPQKQEEMTMLAAEDIAECIRYCLVQPKHCDIARLQIRPTKQII